MAINLIEADKAQLMPTEMTRCEFKGRFYAMLAKLGLERSAQHQ